MTRQDDMDRTLEALMQEGPDALPPRVLDEALDRVEVTRQRPLAMLFDRLSPGSGFGPATPPWAAAIAVAAAAVLVAILYAGLVRPDVGDDEASPSPVPTVLASETPSRTVIAPDTVVQVPDAFIAASHEDEVWISSNGAVGVIDPATNSTREIPVPVAAGDWAGLTFADGDLWVGAWRAGTVYRVDSASGEVIAEIDVGEQAVSLTTAPSGVWVRTVGAVTWQAERIDTVTNEVVATADAGNAITYGHGSLWYSQRGGDRILRADPITGEVTDVILVPREDSCSAIPAGDSVWASCLHEVERPGSVTRIDPETNEVAASIQLSGMPTGGIFEADGLIWLTTLSSQDGGAFEAIDPATNTVARVLRVGTDFDPDNAVVVGGAVWVPNDGQGEVYRFPLDAFTAAP